MNPEDRPRYATQDDEATAGLFTDAPVDLTPLFAAPPAAAGSLGRCLYLGPAGQRCDRPALDDGFCGVHKPGGIVGRITDRKRVLAAVAAIVGILWPYVADLVREIIRWTRTH